MYANFVHLRIPVNKNGNIKTWQHTNRNELIIQNNNNKKQKKPNKTILTNYYALCMDVEFCTEKNR